MKILAKVREKNKQDKKYVSLKSIIVIFLLKSNLLSLFKSPLHWLKSIENYVNNTVN